MALRDAAAGGNRLVALEALRDRLAAEIDGCTSSRDVAALAARLMDVLEDIAEVKGAEPAQEETPLDELKRRRSAKRSA